ncbi:AAA family ATPase [Duffyella gerundensis]|uniref:AAA family ATPase n=1 Tax=Duffyella gerundensis TaxID=1619313 RepID=UPI003F6DEB7A
MRKHRSIKALTNEAEAKNSIKAQYQLYSYYRDGLFVEENVENADRYFDMVVNNFKKSTLRLKSIRLINFRGFSDLTVDLSTEYVVVAANNGYGKTGLLESIFNCLTWLIRNFKGNGANGNFIRPEDIRSKEGVDSASVILDVCLMQGDKINSTYSINLSKTNSDAEEKQDSFYQEFKSLADLYRDIGYFGYNIPVFSFYSVERGNAIKKSEFKKNLDDSNKEFKSNEYAYNTSTAPRFEFFLAWILSEKTIKTMAYIGNADAKELQENIRAIEVLKRINTTDPAVEKAIHDLEKEVAKAKASKSYIEEGDSSIKVDMVFSAIYKFMPEIKNLSFKYDEHSKSIDLFCLKNDCKISVSQLSQGEKTMLSLVCDISLRMISANDKKEDAFNGSGIIIIDEIDLHLHPIWQQTVLLRLKEVFPNVQFIISTHSSNVLSTVSNEYIRKISASENGESGNYDVEIPYFSLGAETSVLQEEIQGVASRPESLEVVRKLNLYKEMVANDQWDTSEAESIFSDLCEWAEGRDPVITKLRLDVSLRKRRRHKK